MTFDPLKKILGNDDNYEDENCEECKYFDDNEKFYVNACKRSPNGCKFKKR